MMLQRQAEGIAIAIIEGNQSRQPIDVDPKRFEKEYQAWKEGKQTARETMNNLNLKPNTFYRRVKEHEAV